MADYMAIVISGAAEYDEKNWLQVEGGFSKLNEVAG